MMTTCTALALTAIRPTLAGALIGTRITRICLAPRFSFARGQVYTHRVELLPHPPPSARCDRAIRHLSTVHVECKIGHKRSAVIAIHVRGVE